MQQKITNCCKKICIGFLVGTLIYMFIGLLEKAYSQQIVLKYSTNLPRHDPLTMAMIEAFDQIEKKTDGKVKFEKFFDGTLIGLRDSWEELLKGTADIVYLTVHISPGEKVMPLHLMLGNAWIGVKDMRTQLKIQKQLLKEFPELAREWSAVKVLSLQGLVELNLHTKKPVRTLSDLKAMQIRGLGAWPKYTFQKLGASLVAMPITELYLALQKGILDGIMLDNTVLYTYKMAEVAPYTTVLGGVLPGVNSVQCMNLNSWKKLPPEIQYIFEDMKEWMDERYIQLREERLKEAMDFLKEKKHEFISFTPGDLSRFHDLLKEEAFEMAKSLDAKGFPATKIFNRMQTLIKQAK